MVLGPQASGAAGVQGSEMAQQPSTQGKRSLFARRSALSPAAVVRTDCSQGGCDLGGPRSRRALEPPSLPRAQGLGSPWAPASLLDTPIRGKPGFFPRRGRHQRCALTQATRGAYARRPHIRAYTSTHSCTCTQPPALQHTLMSIHHTPYYLHPPHTLTGKSTDTPEFVFTPHA